MYIPVASYTYLETDDRATNDCMKWYLLQELLPNHNHINNVVKYYVFTLYTAIYDLFLSNGGKQWQEKHMQVSLYLLGYGCNTCF